MNDILILLTPSQAENLIEFLEVAFIPMVRDTPEIDNLDYVADMCEVYKEIKRTYESVKELGRELERCVPADDIIYIKKVEEKCDG